MSREIKKGDIVKCLNNNSSIIRLDVQLQSGYYYVADIVGVTYIYLIGHGINSNFAFMRSRFVLVENPSELEKLLLL